MKRIFIVFILICLILFLNSCKEKDKTLLIIFETNDGILLEYEYVWDKIENLVLPSPSKEYYEFVGWYEESDFSGESLKVLYSDDYIDIEEITLYAKYNFKTKTEINKLGYDLNGTTISISIYSNRDNLYSEEYIYEDKELRKLQIEYIESKYNCNIEYVITDRLEQRDLQLGQINNRYETV